jgi:membrane fusion protein, multidrug efflux system
MARNDTPGGRAKQGRGAVAAAAALLLVAGGAATAYYLVPVAGEEGTAQEAERATPVVVEPVARGTALDTVATVGEVRARNGITVTSEVSGRVVEVPAGDGSFVDEGDVIVRFDDERERAEVRAAEARADEARLQFERTRELAGRNVVAEAQLDERRAALRTADAEASQARTALEKRTIRAAFPGRLGFITVDPGAVVEPGSAIARLTSPPSVRLRFRLA